METKRIRDDLNLLHDFGFLIDENFMMEIYEKDDIFHLMSDCDERTNNFKMSLRELLNDFESSVCLHCFEPAMKDSNLVGLTKKVRDLNFKKFPTLTNPHVYLDFYRNWFQNAYIFDGFFSLGFVPDAPYKKLLREKEALLGEGRNFFLENDEVLFETFENEMSFVLKHSIKTSSETHCLVTYNPSDFRWEDVNTLLGVHSSLRILNKVFAPKGKLEVLMVPLWVGKFWENKLENPQSLFHYISSPLNETELETLKILSEPLLESFNSLTRQENQKFFDDLCLSAKVLT